MPKSKYEQNKQYAMKWNRENMATVSCRVRRPVAERFRRWAESQGLTVSGAVQAYVLRCIEEPPADDDTNNQP